jgi:hypothetical protein
MSPRHVSRIMQVTDEGEFDDWTCTDPLRFGPSELSSELPGAQMTPLPAAPEYF